MVAADLRTEPRAILLALCLDCQQRTDKPWGTVLGWKLKDAEAPTADSLERSQVMLGLRKPPRKLQQLATTTGQCDTCGSFGSIDHPRGEMPEPVACRVGGCAGTLRPMESRAREPADVAAT